MKNNKIKSSNNTMLKDKSEKKINFKKRLKKETNLTRSNLLNSWHGSWDLNIKGKKNKIIKSNSQSSKQWRVNLKIKKVKKINWKEWGSKLLKIK